MSIILNNQEQQSDLQKRITAELREKQLKKSLVDSDAIPPSDQDPEDSVYMKDMKKTTSLAWVWVVILIAALAAIVALVIITS